MALETLLVENRKNLFLKKPVFRGNSLDRKGKGKKEETKKNDEGAGSKQVTC